MPASLAQNEVRCLQVHHPLDLDRELGAVIVGQVDLHDLPPPYRTKRTCRSSLKVLWPTNSNGSGSPGVPTALSMSILIRSPWLRLKSSSASRLAAVVPVSPAGT